jgi:hypothetical protein
MVEIEFVAPCRSTAGVLWEVLATLHVDGTRFWIDGDQDFAEACDIEVLDTETGQWIKFDADPERWARSLPQGFRSGDLVARIVGDTRMTAAQEHASRMAAGV